MTYGKQEKDSQIQYIFTLEFTSHEDYQKKLEALMGSAPYGVFSHTDSIFFKGTRIYEDFDSAALFAWMFEEPEEKPGFSLQCGKTSVVLDGKALPTPGRDHREPRWRSFRPVDEISISTVSYGRGFMTGRFPFIFPKARCWRWETIWLPI